VLYAIAYLPVMHLFTKPTSRVTVSNGDYYLDDMDTHARIEGDKLTGLALYAKMPFELTRVENFPPVPDQTPPSVGVKNYIIDHCASIVALDRKSGAIRWRLPEAPLADAWRWSFPLFGNLLPRQHPFVVLVAAAQFREDPRFVTSVEPIYNRQGRLYLEQEQLRLARRKEE